MSAYRSLAAAANVDLDVVVRHAANNTLSAVVDKVRRRDTLETRSPSAHGTDPAVLLAYLYRRRVLSALSDRSAMVGGS
jgi:hypothetical protein